MLRESNLEHDDTDNAVFMFAFQDVVDEVVADFHDTGKRIVREVPEDLPPVTVDRRRMQDVLVNLVDNALKYSVSAGAASRSEPASTTRRSRSGCATRGSGSIRATSHGSSSASTRWTSPPRVPTAAWGSASISSRACSSRWAGPSMCRARRGRQHVLGHGSARARGGPPGVRSVPRERLARREPRPDRVRLIDDARR